MSLALLLFRGGSGPVGGSGYDVAFNFRSTAGFVTDPAGTTNDLGAAYPRAVSVNGHSTTVGWSADLTANSRDRNSGIDPRLSGIVFTGSGTAVTWRIDLPQSGGPIDYYIAVGDAGSGNAYDYSILDSDGSTVLHSFTGGGQAAATWFDAQGTLHASAAAWASSNAPRTITPSGATLYVRLPGSANSNVLAHVRFVKAGSSSTSLTAALTDAADTISATIGATARITAALVDATDIAAIDADILSTASLNAVDATDMATLTIGATAAVSIVLTDAADTVAASLTLAAPAANVTAALVDADDVIAVAVGATASLSAALVDANDAAAIEADATSTASLNAVDATDAVGVTLAATAAVTAALVDAADAISASITIAPAGALLAAALADADDAATATIVTEVRVSADLVDADDLAAIDADVSSTASLNAVDATDAVSVAFAAVASVTAALADAADQVAALLTVADPGEATVSANLVDADDAFAAIILAEQPPAASLGGPRKRRGPDTLDFPPEWLARAGIRADLLDADDSITMMAGFGVDARLALADEADEIDAVIGLSWPTATLIGGAGLYPRRELVRARS